MSLHTSWCIAQICYWSCCVVNSRQQVKGIKEWSTLVPILQVWSNEDLLGCRSPEKADLQAGCAAHWEADLREHQACEWQAGPRILFFLVLGSWSPGFQDKNQSSPISLVWIINRPSSEGENKTIEVPFLLLTPSPTSTSLLIQRDVRWGRQVLCSDVWN